MARSHNLNKVDISLYKDELANIEDLAGDFIYGVLVTAKRKTKIIESMSQLEDVGPDQAFNDEMIVTNKMVVLKVGVRCSDALKEMIIQGDIVNVRELDLAPTVTPYGMSPDKGAPPRPNPHCNLYSFGNDSDMSKYQRAKAGPQVLVREHQILAKLKELR